MNKTLRRAIDESRRLVTLTPLGGQWTIIEHPLPDVTECATTGGQFSWPYPQAQAYRREARVRVALQLLGYGESAASEAMYAASQRHTTLKDIAANALERLLDGGGA